MGLRCSMFGHEYGDSEVERERDEQGSEVVVTVREIAICSRCGERTVRSENTEVRTTETPHHEHTLSDDPVFPGGEDEETGADDGPGTAETVPDAGLGEPEAGAGDPDPEPRPEGTVADQPTPVDSETDDPTPHAEPREAPPAEPAGDDDTDEPDPTEDEGVEILEDSPEDHHAPPGQEAARSAEPPHPDEPGPADPEAAPGPTDPSDFGDPERPSESAGPPDDDGVIMDEPADEGPGERGHGEWPESDDVGPPDDVDEERDWPGGDEPPSNGNGPEDASGADAELVEGTTEGDVGQEGPEAGITREERADSPGGSHRRPEGDFYCPECGHTAPSSRASLRAGDICPECRRGYLSREDG